GGERERLRECQAGGGEARLQRFTLVERHGHEQLPVLGLADFVDRADVRMVERGSGARLRGEPRLGIGVGAEMWRKKLQSDLTSESLILSFVDDAHSAGAQGILHEVMSDPEPGTFGRRRWHLRD